MIRTTLLGLALVSATAFGQEVEKPAKETKHVVLSSNNSIVLQDYFYTQSVVKLKQKLIKLDNRLKDGEKIYLVLDSGGGSIVAGFELINLAQGLKHEVVTITIWSASMAFQTVQALGSRYILKNGVLMSHKARGGFYGQFPDAEAETRMSFWKGRINTADQEIADRAGMTVEEYKKLYEYEYWCEGKACVDKNFADAVITASCDKTLEGTKDIVEYKEWFWDQGILLKWHAIQSKCPLNVGALDTYLTAERLRVGDNGKLTPSELDLYTKKFKKEYDNKRNPIFQFNYTPKYK
ncbi:ATP-dependent Clp protease proteolytic subunit [bacterium]|nr:ATP-dependent Clp protease proteolytic subunit [bacterium]